MVCQNWLFLRHHKTFFRVKQVLKQGDKVVKHCGKLRSKMASIGKTDPRV